MIVLYDTTLVVLSIVVAIVASLTALAIVSATKWSDASQLTKWFAVVNGAIVMGSGIWSMHFIAMMAVQFPIVVHYRALENVLSLALAIVVTGIGLWVVSGHRNSPLYIPVAGLFMGLGIVGMHYLGMAGIVGCGVSYDWAGVALSIAIAVLAATAALWFAFSTRGALATAIGGVVMGLAIAAMHYTAMFATYFSSLDDAVFLAPPYFSQDALAYMMALATTFICAVNVGILAMARFGRTRQAG